MKNVYTALNDQGFVISVSRAIGKTPYNIVICNIRCWEGTSMAKNARPFKATFSSLMGHWLVCGLLGMLIPCLVYYLANLDQFERWQMLTPAPPGAVELLDGNPYAVTVRTVDRQILKWDPQNQRWVPSVTWEDPRVTIQSCDPYANAFKASTHPPEDVLTCTAFAGYDHDGNYLVLAAIDQQGNIWKWEKPSQYLEGIIYILIGIMGAFCGVVAGSVVWLERKGVADRKQSGAPAQPAEAAAQPVTLKKRSWVWMLALLPIVCLVGVGLVRLAGGLITSVNREIGPESTVLPGLSEFYTEEAAWYSAPPVTPNPAGPAYDFAAQCPGAQWIFSVVDSWTCGDSRPPDQASVSVLWDPPEGQEWSGQALRLYIPVKQRDVTGRYPTWFIRPGEHFRATLLCPAETIECDLTFTLYLEQQEDGRTDLGTWRLTNEQRSQEIDIDLSQFAGKIVSVVLETINSDPSEIEQVVPQIALWVNPRIEYLPGE